MADRVIAQRELRNNIASVLRAAESGESFTITVRGQPVARLVPPGTSGRPQVDVDRRTISQLLDMTADPDLAAELDAIEEPVVSAD